MKCCLDSSEVGGSRNRAFLVLLFSFRTVAHFDNVGQKEGKNEGNHQQELAKQILLDQGQRAVSAHHLPRELLGASMGRRTLLFLTPEV